MKQFAIKVPAGSQGYSYGIIVDPSVTLIALQICVEELGLANARLVYSDFNIECQAFLENLTEELSAFARIARSC